MGLLNMSVWTNSTEAFPALHFSELMGGQSYLHEQASDFTEVKLGSTDDCMAPPPATS